MEIGLDVVEIRRMARLARRGAFLRRVFTPAEVRYCRSKARAPQHFAARFAAKEAVWKALGRAGLALNSIEVVRGPGGRPEPRVGGRRVPGLSLSLTHADLYAAAVAVFAPPRASSRRSEARKRAAKSRSRRGRP